MIKYYRFCCRIRIADDHVEEVPGGEFLAIEEGSASDRQKQFADSRVNQFSDWFHESPALMAHLRALEKGKSLDVRRRLVDTEAACKATGVDAKTLYRWRREGRLTAHRLTWSAAGARWSAGWDVLELPPTGSGPPPRKNFPEPS